MKTTWIDKVKDHLLSAACTALVTMVVGGIAMLIRHDAKIQLIDYKVNIIMRRVAPDVPIPKSLSDVSDNDNHPSGIVKQNADSRQLLH